MTAFTGTVIKAGIAGERGTLSLFTGKFDLTGALASGDTITFSNVFPQLGTFVVRNFRYESGRLDTNTSPTAFFTIGDGTDADGYLTTRTPTFSLLTGAVGRVSYEGDGACLDVKPGDSGAPASRDVVITFTASPATAATTGTIYVRGWIEAV